MPFWTYLFCVLTELLQWEVAHAFTQGDLLRIFCAGLALGIMGLSGVDCSRQRWSGITLAILGVILWLIYLGTGID